MREEYTTSVKEGERVTALVLRVREGREAVRDSAGVDGWLTIPRWLTQAQLLFKDNKDLC